MMSTVSLVGSVATAAATAYFWIVRARRERPCLRIYVADRATEIILGVYRGESRGLQFRTNVIVANTSSMPNAIIGVEIALKHRDGSWDDVPAPRVAAIPLNVPSMTTVRLEIEWTVTLPALAAAEALRANEIVTAYFEHYFATPSRFGIAIWALGEREFRAVLPLTSERIAAAARLTEAA
jgi:hypothetical protein